MGNINFSIDVSSIISKIIRGAAYSLVIKVVTTGINFLIAIMLARLLNPEGYGQYILAMTLITLLSILTTLGLPNLIVRNVAAYVASKEWKKLKGLLYFSNYTVVILSIIISLSGYLISDYYHLLFKSGGKETFVIALIMLPLLSLISVHSAMLRGFHYIVTGQVSGTLIKSMLFFISISIIFFSGYSQDAASVMMVHVYCAGAAFIIGAYFLLKRMPMNTRNITYHLETWVWLKSALPLLLMGGLLTMNQQTDLLMIGYHMETSSVGIYQVAIRISELVTFVLVAGNTAIGPTISALYQQDKMNELQETITYFVRAIFLTSIPVVIIIFMFGKQIIELLFGNVYIGAYDPLFILLFGQCVNVLIGPAGILLIMTGHEKMAAKGLLMSLLVNIFLNSILIPEYGIKGAAIATSSSLIIWNILLYRYSLKATNINCSIFRSR